MTAAPPGTVPANRSAAGRGFLWLGILLALLAPVGYGIQLQMKQLFIPW
jgi:hypothetical protein